jgi:hypothetical protein
MSSWYTWLHHVQFDLEPWLAASCSLVAIRAWERHCSLSGDHVVQLFEGSGATWTLLRVRWRRGGFRYPGGADGQQNVPLGLRFTGTGLVVADAGNCRVSMFRVEDGSFVRHVATGLGWPYDVEECEGGWLADALLFLEHHRVCGWWRGWWWGPGQSEYQWQWARGAH